MCERCGSPSPSACPLHAEPHPGQSGRRSTDGWPAPLVDTLRTGLATTAEAVGTRHAAITVTTPRRAPLRLETGAPPPPATCRCCAEVAGATGEVRVGDTGADPRFAAVGHADGDDDAPRLLVAVPVHDPQGGRLGTLCVGDARPRPADATAAVATRLHAFARLAGSAIAAVEPAVSPRPRLDGAWGAPVDEVTGLPTRRYVRGRLRSFLARADAAQRVAVHILGVDHFHAVNEDHGHTSGDEVLHVLARRLDRAVRAGDAVARLGGDQFAVVQPDPPDVAAAQGLAQRLVDAVREPIALAGAVVRLTASVGTAVAAGTADGDEVPVTADSAMRRAKEAGGDRATLLRVGPGAETSRRRMRRRLLAQAIADDQLDVRFQPKVYLASGRLHGAEALARWFTGDGVEVPPGEFIPLAEDSGLVIPLGRAVLARACAGAAGWPDGGRVAVNLSPVQLVRDDVVAVVDHALATGGLAPDRLELEVTESVLLHDIDRVTATLERLRALGVSVALDDFGTGYSSFAMLWRLPLDTLKLDRAFVRALDVDARMVEVVGGMVEMAKRLGLTTVAEGVETSGQRERLCELGCELGQGFLFGAAAAVPAVSPAAASPPDRGRASRSRARSTAAAPPGSG